MAPFAARMARRVQEAPTTGVRKQKRPATKLRRLMWKSLPPELLYLLVEQTEGLKNLKAWCAATATSDSVGLHSFAFRRYHRRFVVSRQNLVSERTVCTRRTLACIHVDTHEIRRTLFPPPSNANLPPLGHSIECLVLNFQTGYTGGSMTMPEFRKVEFSMRHLLPELECCKEVDQYGDLVPALFEDIIGSIDTTVERLSVRKQNSHAPPHLLGGFTNPNRWPTISMDLPFERLRRCKNITHLQVGNLKCQEVPNLVVAGRDLKNLRNLHVEADPGFNAVTCRFLTGMFRNYNHARLPFGFPTSLRSLTIVDNDEYVRRRSRNYSKLTLSSTCEYDGANEDIFSADFIMAKLENLEYLYLDLGCARLSLALLKRILPDQLRHLSIALLRFAPIEDAHHGIWTMIENELPNLEELQVLNAWAFPDFLRSLRALGKTKFVDADQVLLADPPPPSTTLAKQTERSRKSKPRDKFHLNTRILGYDNWQQLWGTKVEHLRLDHWDFERMTIDGISNASAGLQNLKVLVINGGPKYPDDGLSAWTLDPEWHPHGILGRPVPSDVPLPEYDVVRNIARQGWDKLRVIVVNDYHYWIRVRTFSNDRLTISIKRS